MTTETLLHFKRNKNIAMTLYLVVDAVVAMEEARGLV